MLRTIITLVSVVFISKSMGQFESHRWYFTNTSDKGLYFDLVTNIPSVTSEHANPFAADGSGVLNNPTDGSLMFYTTGDKVYDLNHDIMPNGSALNSHASSDMKGAICTKPGNCNQYYIFQNTGAVEAAPGNFYYSIVDLTLPGNGTTSAPLGDVVSGQKNIFLKNNTSQGYCLIKSSSSAVTWLIISTLDLNDLSIYKIDSTGIALHGVYDITNTITDFRSLNYSYEAGKICVLSGVENEPALLLDFDRTTGTITVNNVIPGTPTGSGAFYWMGLIDGDWSSDGTKLYFSKYRVSGVAGGKIYQYDLNTPSNPATVVYSQPGTDINVIAGVKRGPDGKIYFVHSHPTHSYRYIGVINDPNLAGTACNPNALGVDLGVSVGAYGIFSEHLHKNSKPIAVNDTITFGCKDTIISDIDILSSDSDADDDIFDLFFYSVPSDVIINYNPDNTVNIQLLTAGNVDYSLPYQICDLNCFSQCDTATLNITRNCVVGLEKHDLKISLYPNPAKKEVTIQLSDHTITNSEIQLFDQTGRALETNVHSLSTGTFNMSFESIESGIYFVGVESDGETIYYKLIVMN